MMTAGISILIVVVVIYAATKKINIYEAFVNGAKDSFPVLIKILPYMAAMMVAIQLLNKSGIMLLITSLLEKPLNSLGMPSALVPMALLRPFSGSAAMALVADIFKRYGADSFVGLAASVMMGSSETVFYTISLYFGSIGIQKTRFTLPVALVASIVSIICSIALCRIIL